MIPDDNKRYSLAFALPCSEPVPDLAKLIFKTNSAADPHQRMLHHVQRICRAFSAIPESEAIYSSADNSSFNKNIQISDLQLGARTAKDIQTGSISIYLYGSHADIIQAKAELLQLCPKIISEQIPIPALSQIIANDGKIQQQFFSVLDSIAKESGAGIYLLSAPSINDDYESSSSFAKNFHSNSWNSGDQQSLSRSSESDDDNSPFILYISGDIYSVHHARTLLKIYFDKARGLTVIKRFVPLYKQTVFGGRDLEAFQDLINDYGINVYLANPLGKCIGKKSKNLSTCHELAITGPKEAIELVEKRLQKIEAVSRLVSRNINTDATKIDNLLSERADELLKIMDNNSVFIQFPHIGSCVELITVQAKSEEDANRAMKAMNKLLAEQHIATIFFLPITSERQSDIVKPNKETIELLNSAVCFSKAQIILCESHLRMAVNEIFVYSTLNYLTPIWTPKTTLWHKKGSAHGLTQNKPALDPIGTPFNNRSSISSSYGTYCRSAVNIWVKIVLEAPLNDLEFISGKKFGKIDKIKQEINLKYGQGDIKLLCIDPMAPKANMNSASSVICINSTNHGLFRKEGLKQKSCGSNRNDVLQGNFNIEISATDMERAVRASELVALEFPAELTFYVAEEFHKRLIGFRGEQIQRVMKMYNSYIEFSARPFDSVLNHNVLVRTPEKFHENLYSVRSLFLEAATCFANGLPWQGLMPSKQTTCNSMSFQAIGMSRNDDSEASSLPSLRTFKSQSSLGSSASPPGSNNSKTSGNSPALNSTLNMNMNMNPSVPVASAFEPLTTNNKQSFMNLLASNSSRKMALFNESNHWLFKNDSNLGQSYNKTDYPFGKQNPQYTSKSMLASALPQQLMHAFSDIDETPFQSNPLDNGYPRLTTSFSKLAPFRCN